MKYYIVFFSLTTNYSPLSSSKYLLIDLFLYLPFCILLLGRGIWRTLPFKVCLHLIVLATIFLDSKVITWQIRIDATFLQLLSEEAKIGIFKLYSLW